MAKCKICGLDVVVGDVYHSDCIAAELEHLRAENAALREAVKRLDGECSECAHILQPGACELSNFDCTDCPPVVNCACRNCRNNSNWEWKGVAI